MNILFIGNCDEYFCELVANSKYCKRFYVAFSSPSQKYANIGFESVKDLAIKAQALEIDVAILFDKDFLSENIIEEFKSYKVNLLTVNKKWLNLQTNPLAAKQLLNHYNIATAKVLKAPVEFPVKLVLEESLQEIVVNSLQDLIAEIKEYQDLRYHLEEVLVGENLAVLSLWDGKNLWYNQLETQLTEVQKDRLDVLKAKLLFMFTDEKADFVSFFVTNVVWANNDWIVLGFEMGLPKTQVSISQVDFLYLLNSAIYQKLNEIES